MRWTLTHVVQLNYIPIKMTIQKTIPIVIGGESAWTVVAVVGWA